MQTSAPCLGPDFTMVDNNKNASRRAAAATLLVLLGFLAALSAPPAFFSPAWPGLFSSRALSSAAGAVDAWPWDVRLDEAHPALVASLATPPDRDAARETPFFWHVPKSGGTTVKRLYRCMKKSVDVRSRKTDILERDAAAAIRSGDVDLVVSTLPKLAVLRLFSGDHQARALAVFRHPVDRLISLFYYLQTASWERGYRPDWKDMDLLEWASYYPIRNDMVRALAGEDQPNHVRAEDLQRAQEIVRSRFVVGLTEEMEESVRRFNVVMGIKDDTTPRHRACMRRFFGPKPERANANPHPAVDQDDPAWRVLAARNALDVALFEHVRATFEEQATLIDAYARGATQIDGYLEARESER